MDWSGVDRRWVVWIGCLVWSMVLQRSPGRWWFDVLSSLTWHSWICMASEDVWSVGKLVLMPNLFQPYLLETTYITCEYIYIPHTHIYIMYVICIIIVSVLFFLLPWHGHHDFWCFTLDSFQGECTIVVEVCQGQLSGEMVAVVFFGWASRNSKKRCAKKMRKSNNI